VKLLLEPLEVEVCQGEPRFLRWRRQTWPVQQILDRWIWRGHWWRDPALEGETRRYYRVQSRGATLEIYSSGNRWVLSRVWD